MCCFGRTVPPSVSALYQHSETFVLSPPHRRSSSNSHSPQIAIRRRPRSAANSNLKLVTRNQKKSVTDSSFHFAHPQKFSPADQRGLQQESQAKQKRAFSPNPIEPMTKN